MGGRNTVVGGGNCRERRCHEEVVKTIRGTASVGTPGAAVVKYALFLHFG